NWMSVRSTKDLKPWISSRCKNTEEPPRRSFSRSVDRAGRPGGRIGRFSGGPETRRKNAKNGGKWRKAAGWTWHKTAAVLALLPAGATERAERADVSRQETPAPAPERRFAR